MKIRLVAAVAAANLLVLAGGTASAGVLRHENSPRDAVTDFLDALARGDVADALELVQQREKKDRTLLTDGVLPEKARITKPKVTSVVRTGDDATADVTFEVHGKVRSAHYSLKRPKRTGIGATSWHLTNALTNLEITDAEGFATVTVNGVKVPLEAGRAHHATLPGYYTGTLPSHPLFTGTMEPVAVADAETFLTAEIEVKDAAKKEAKRAAEAGIRACFAGTRELAGVCSVQGVDREIKRPLSQGVVFDDARWKVLEIPELLVFPLRGDNTLGVFALDPGYASVNVRISAPSVNPGYFTRVDDEFPFRVVGIVTFKGSKGTWKSVASRDDLET